jgi:flagellar FliL protein
MKKLIILGGIGFVILAVLGGGGYFAWKKFAAKPAAQVDPKKDETGKPSVPGGEVASHGEEEEEEPSAGGEGAAAPAVMIYQKIVNLDKKNAYLKVELHILFRDPELGKAATGDKPTPEASEIRATLLELLSGKTLEEASDLETRESVRKEIKDKLNEKFAPKPPKPGEKEDPKHKKPKKPVKDVLVVDWAISA